MKIQYSAIVPTHNNSDQINQALESIYHQTELPAEIILSDDNSTDNTYSILSNHKSPKMNVILLRNIQNEGAAKNRNLAVKYSTSEILIFFDGDDESLPDRSRTHLELHAQGADLVFCSTIQKYGDNYEFANINDDFREVMSFPEVATSIFLGENYGKKFYTPACAMSCRLETFIELQGFDANFRRLEDIDFFLKAVNAQKVIAFSSKIGVVRNLTTGPGKSPEIEFQSQNSLLEKWTEKLNLKLVYEAKLWNELRNSYFATTPIKGIKLLPKVLMSSNLRKKILTKLISRGLHDYRIRASLK